MAKTNKIPNVPNLRFPGFDSNWEVKKLEEVLTIGSGRDYKHLGEGDIPVYGTGGYMTSVSDYLYEGESVGIGRKGTIDKPVFLKGKFWTVDTLFYTHSFEKVIPFFIFLLFQRINWKKYNEASGVPSLSKSTLAKIKIKLPELPEQQKIATFLTLIDCRIQTQSEIIQRLESLMLGLKQKIFSQELRFKDVNGNKFPNWEMKKMGDIGKFQTSSVDKLSKENEREVFLINYMNVYKHENINSKTIKSFQKVTAKNTQIDSCNLRKGDILFTPSSETPKDIGHSVVIFEDLEKTVFSYHLMRFRPKIELNILYSHYFCNAPNVLKQLSKLATGSTRFTISVKSFSRVKVLLPCLQEQAKISNFLLAIDNKIEKEKGILEQYQQQKKYLLQNLFI